MIFFRIFWNKNLRIQFYLENRAPWSSGFIWTFRASFTLFSFSLARPGTFFHGDRERITHTLRFTHYIRTGNYCSFSIAAKSKNSSPFFFSFDPALFIYWLDHHVWWKTEKKSSCHTGPDKSRLRNLLGLFAPGN